jgi:autotransporter-associated beta strand protein
MKIPIHLKLLAFILAATMAKAAPVTGWATTSTTTTLSNTTTASPSWGNGTLNLDNAKASNLYATFPAVTLAISGDSLKLTGSATLVGANVTGTAGGFFRFGLFDVYGKSDTNGWLGYMAYSTGSASTGTLYERTAGNTGAFTSSTGATSVATAPIMGTGVVLTNTQYNFTVNITRNATSALVVTTSLKRSSDNLDFGNLTFTDTTPLSSFAFNRVGFQNTTETNADQIQMSNVDVTFTPGNLDHFTISGISGNQTVGQATSNITITAKDVNENTVAYNGPVTYSGTANITGTSSSFTSGNLTGVSITPTVVGGNKTFIITGAGKTGTATFNVQPAAAASFTVAGFPSPQALSTAGNVTVTAKDAFGNIATGYTGTVRFTSGDSTANLPSNYTFVAGDNGVHTFSGVTFNTANQYTLTATDTVTSSITGSQSGIVISPDDAAVSLAVSGFPSPQSAGTAGSITVTAKTSGGTTSTSYSGTVHFTTSSSLAGLPSDYTFVPGDNGAHTFTGVTLNSTGSHSITATDTAKSFVTGSQSGITVTGGSATGFVLSGFSSPRRINGASSITVTAVDAYGNTATGYRGTVSLTSSDSIATLPSNYSFLSGDAGVHTFTGLTLNTPGTQSVTVSDTISSVSATQSGISVIIPTTFNWAAASAGNWSDDTKWTADSGIAAAPLTAGGSNYILNFSQPGSYTATQDLTGGMQMNQLNFSSTGNSTANVIIAGNNTITLTSNGTTTPQINLGASTTANITSPISLAADLSFGGTGNGTLTLSGLISGSSALIKNGPSKVAINGLANSYSGGTIVNAGTLSVGVSDTTPATVGTGRITVNSGGILSLERGTRTNNVTLDGGKMISNNGFGCALSGTVTLNATSTIQATYAMSISGITSGSGGIIKTGNGALTLGNELNKFTGPISIQAGKINTYSINSVSGGQEASGLGAPLTTADGTISIGASTTNGTLSYLGFGETTDRVINLAGTTGGATLELAASSGLLKFTSDLTASGSGNKSLTLQGSGSGKGEVSGRIVDSASGTTSLIKSGSVLWTLSGANTYTGNTSVTAGTLLITKPASLYSANETNWTAAKISVSGNATLAVNAGGNDEFTTAQIGTLLTNLSSSNGGGLKAYASIGINTNNATGAVTINSAISNSSGTSGGVLGIMKDGNGTLNLTGTNTYNGTTNISKGTLSISGSGSLGNGGIYSGAIQFGIGASLVYSSSANQTLSGLIDGSGSITQSGTGTLSLVGNPADPNTYWGDTTVNSGILAVNGSAIDDLGYLIINGGKVQATGVEIVDQLYFGTVQKAAGTWGASGSGATHIDNARFAGPGTILVTTGSTAVDNTLATWIATQGLEGAAANATADPDGDGISNALECILGGQPNPALANSNSAAVLPTATKNVAGEMVFTFHRTDVSEDITTLAFQWSAGLTFNANDQVTVGATSATANGVTVTVVEDSPDAATDTITITVPASKASGGKLFGRLQATAP